MCAISLLWARNPYPQVIEHLDHPAKSNVAGHKGGMRLFQKPRGPTSTKQ